MLCGARQRIIIAILGISSIAPETGLNMDKWTELRHTIRELRNNNQDKPDVANIMHYLLELMKVLDEKDGATVNSPASVGIHQALSE